MQRNQRLILQILCLPSMIFQNSLNAFELLSVFESALALSTLQCLGKKKTLLKPHTSKGMAASITFLPIYLPLKDNAGNYTCFPRSLARESIPQGLSTLELQYLSYIWSTVSNSFTLQHCTACKERKNFAKVNVNHIYLFFIGK